MAIKNSLIELLENNRGRYLSGEQVAMKLGVTRAAVWKNIKVLKEEGYKIDAITNKGYMLSNMDDSISDTAIYNYLVNSDMRIEVYDEIDSTNKQIKIRSDEEEGLVIVAKSQTKGRARQGKQFFSPKDTGIYFSVLLKPKCKEKEAFIIALMAGVAVCEAIHNVCKIMPTIKKINDICIGGKKICGILTQASFDLEDESTEYIALGIGINMYPPDNGFPSDIMTAVGALYDERKGNIKNKLLASILDNIWEMYKNPDKDKILSKYMEYNENKEITISIS